MPDGQATIDTGRAAARVSGNTLAKFALAIQAGHVGETKNAERARPSRAALPPGVPGHSRAKQAPGLDNILYGGLAPNRLYLVEGMPGSGKATLALQFLSAGRAAGERCLHVTLSETQEELKTVVASHGLTPDRIDVFELAPAASVFSAGREMTLLHPWEVDLDETVKLITKGVNFEASDYNPNTCGSQPVACCTAAITLDEAAKSGTSSV